MNAAESMAQPPGGAALEWREYRGPLPVPEPESLAYWDGLRAGELRILRCRACAYWVHYPLACCPRCHSFDLAAHPVSGRGFVYSFTVVCREFVRGIEPPYVVGLIELDEQPGLRLVTNLVDVDPAHVMIGMRVRAVFCMIADEQALVYFTTDPKSEEHS